MSLLKKLSLAVHDVDSILSEFSKPIKRLEAAIAAHSNHAAAADAESIRQADLAGFHEAEAARAAKVAKKFKDLIS